MCIFHEITVDSNRVGINALRWLNAYGSPHRTESSRVIKYPWVKKNGLIGLFNGEKHNDICGTGMVIRIRHNISYRLRMGACSGTHTKDELVALWGLLYFS